MPDMQACHTKYVIKLQTLIGVEFSTAGFLEQNCSRYACIFFQRLGTPDLITDPAQASAGNIAEGTQYIGIVAPFETEVNLIQLRT